MAGAGYKLFNTGDVLTAAQVNTYLQEQTVMVFADATARTTALSGVLAEGMVTYLKSTKVVEIYNGTAWASLDDPNAIQNTIVDAKGDLITATANDTPSRLAVGNSGETLVADSSTTTGLRWQSAANQNFVINGGMDIWQRGTSFTGASPYYTADRFVGLRATAALGATFSRQSSGLTSFQYSIRVQRDSGNTGTTALILSQCLESSASYPLAGQTVTLSFYAKCGANYSSASSALSSQIRYGTGTDQNYITGSYTGDTQVVAGTHTLTTSWQRFYITGTVNSAATEVGFDLRYTPVGTASTNDWFEITGVQLELGSVPTTFKRAGGTLAGELAACKRYYQKILSIGVALANSAYYNASYVFCAYKFEIEMRTSPTLLIATGTNYYYNAANNALDYLNSLTIANTTTYSCSFFNSTEAAGTTGHAGVIGSDNANSSMALNAEL